MCVSGLLVTPFSVCCVNLRPHPPPFNPLLRALYPDWLFLVDAPSYCSHPLPQWGALDAVRERCRGPEYYGVFLKGSQARARWEGIVNAAVHLCSATASLEAGWCHKKSINSEDMTGKNADARCFSFPVAFSFCGLVPLK